MLRPIQQFRNAAFTSWQRIAATLIGCFLFASPSLAQPTIKCNKKQTICEINARDLITGDEIAIFNDRNQIVAEGRVVKVKNAIRRVKITKRFGKIKRNNTIAITNRGKDRNSPQSFMYYRTPFPDQAGASLGIISLSFGTGGVGTEFSGYYQKKMERIPLLVRGAYIIAGSDVANENAELAETATLSVSGFGVVGGSSITLWPYDHIGFRFEGGLGFFLASRSISEGNINDFDTRFDEGFGLWLRGSGGIVYDTGTWQLQLEAAPMFVHSAAGIAIVVGMAKNL